MSRLTDLIRERRRRQEGADPLLAIYQIFINPTTKQEGDLPRIATVVGGPTLQQEPNESDDAFEARVTSVAHQLRGENKHN